MDVVVVSHNSRDHLRACLRPLLVDGGCNVRPFLILVDNDSVDGGPDTVRDLAVRIVEQENHGFGHACNVGAREGCAPFILFLNPDAAVDVESISLLTRVLAADGGVGAVGPRIVNSDGSLALSQRRFPRIPSTVAQALFVHRLLPQATWASEIVTDPARYQQRGEADWLSGACLLVRRDGFERVGGFDERFFMYREDTELCRALREQGYRIVFEPAALARHLGGASADRSGLLPVLAQSRIAYAEKNFRRPTAAAQRIGVALEALTHSVLCAGGMRARRGHLRALRAAVLGGPRPDARDVVSAP